MIFIHINPSMISKCFFLRLFDWMKHFLDIEWVLLFAKIRYCAFYIKSLKSQLKKKMIIVEWKLNRIASTITKNVYIHLYSCSLKNKNVKLRILIQWCKLYICDWVFVCFVFRSHWDLKRMWKFTWTHRHDNIREYKHNSDPRSEHRWNDYVNEIPNQWWVIERRNAKSMYKISCSME